MSNPEPHDEALEGEARQSSHDPSPPQSTASPAPADLVREEPAQPKTDATLQAAIAPSSYAGDDLSGRSFDRGALQGCSFRDSNVEDATFYDADLRESDFRGARGLYIRQLAGADLTGAQLPDNEVSEPRIGRAEQLSRHAGAVFLGLLVSALYSLLTIVSTADDKLLTNSAASTLPIIETPIPIVWFYLLGPLALLGINIYFQFCMQNLWEEVSELPAIFPDGLPLYRKLHSWLLIEIPSRHFERLRSEATLYSRVRYWIFALMIRWIAPLTLAAFWLRYMPRHDWSGTVYHLVILVLCLGSMALFRLRTLRLFARERAYARPALRRQKIFETCFTALATALIAGITWFAVNGALRPADDVADAGGLRYVVPELLQAAGFSPFADLRGAELSERPAGDGFRDDAATGARAQLSGRDLRYARLADAYLARANLVRTDLEGADLTSVYAEDANLTRSCLRFAHLHEARLRDAALGFSMLAGARMDDADLRGADLSFAVADAATIWSGASLDNAALLQLPCDAPPPPDPGGSPCRVANQPVTTPTCSELAENLCEARSLKGALLDPQIEAQMRDACPEKLGASPADASEGPTNLQNTNRTNRDANDASVIRPFFKRLRTNPG